AGTVNQRFERYATAYEQGSHSLGGINLMSGDRQKISAELADAGRNLADGLGGVGVEQDAVLLGDTGAILDRLNRADLVVCMHDADEDSAWRDGFAKIVGVDPPCSVHTQIGHPRALALEKSARPNDGWVLDPSADDMIAFVAKREEHAFKSKVICFAAPARENDLVFLAAEQRRHLPARRFKSCLRRRRRPMPA